MQKGEEEKRERFVNRAVEVDEMWLKSSKNLKLTIGSSSYIVFFFPRKKGKIKFEPAIKLHHDIFLLWYVAKMESALLMLF